MATANLRAVITAEDRTGGAMKSATGGFGKMAGAMAVGTLAAQAFSAVFQKAMSLITNNIDNAIRRVDTLERFPTVMKNMGFSSQDAEKQIRRMSDELRGLPTSLDSLTTFVQRVAPMSDSVEEATDIALAFNNAVLAGGGPIERQADAIEQFSQMLATGKPDMMAWRTLQEAMPATLSQVAKKLGITSGNTTELYNQIKTGTLSFEDFTQAVLDLNDKGLEGFKNFDEQARDATKGIETGMQNMNTAVTRGIEAVITAIGSENINQFFSNLGSSLERLGNFIAESVVPKLKEMWHWFEINILPTLQKVQGFIRDQIMAAFRDFKAALDSAGISSEQWKKILIVLGVAIFTLVAPILMITAVGVAFVLLIIRIVGWLAKLISWLHNTTRAVVNFFNNGWLWLKNSLVAVFGAIVGAVSSGINRVVGQVRSLKDKIVGAFSGAASWLVNAGRNIIQGLINGVKNMAGSLKSTASNVVSDALNSIPGAGIAKGLLSKIRGNAKGTDFFGGGLTMVGERGPELVSLPRGSKVHPADKTARMAGGGTVINITVPMMTGSANERRKVARQLIKDIQDVAAMNGKTAGEMLNSKFGLVT